MHKLTYSYTYIRIHTVTYSIYIQYNFKLISYLLFFADADRLFHLVTESYTNDLCKNDVLGVFTIYLTFLILARFLNE